MNKTSYLVLAGILALGLVAFVLSNTGLLEGKWKKVATVDTDLDGLTDAFEDDNGTDPKLADTDEGGSPDGTELKNKTDPLDPLDDGTMQPLEGEGADMDDAKVDQPKDGSIDYDDVKVTR